MGYSHLVNWFAGFLNHQQYHFVLFCMGSCQVTMKSCLPWSTRTGPRNPRTKSSLPKIHSCSWCLGRQMTFGGAHNLFLESLGTQPSFKMDGNGETTISCLKMWKWWNHPIERNWLSIGWWSKSSYRKWSHHPVLTGCLGFRVDIQLRCISRCWCFECKWTGFCSFALGVVWTAISFPFT